MNIQALHGISLASQLVYLLLVGDGTASLKIRVTATFYLFVRIGAFMTRDLDEIDFKILRELQFNARITNADLAKRVSLSPSPCWNRVRRLELAGVIKEYVAIIDQSAIGMPDSVILNAKLEQHDDATLQRFERELSVLPEVVEAYLVTGDYDYVFRVAAAGTAGYERFLRDRVYKLPFIQHTRSSFVLRSLKQTYSAQPPVRKKE